MRRRPKVALLIRTDSEWHRNLIRGVAQFAVDHGGWQITIPPAEKNGEVMLPEDWEGDGVICRLTSDRLLQRVEQANLPSLNVSWLGEQATMPKVISDEAKCAEVAASFFIEKNYENFTFVGFPPSQNYSNVIESTIRRMLSVRGYRLQSFNMRDGLPLGIDMDELESWLVDLPKPNAVIAWSSEVGQVITQASRAVNLRMPMDLSVVCIEHDSLWSLLAPISLSNVDQDPWRVGYTAAKVLITNIQGATPSPVPITIPPIGIVQRLSTQETLVRDPELSLAIKHISENASKGISVGRVVEMLQISRRALETKFKRELGCSPAAYIKRVRLREVARMLRETRLSISEIAKRTGFQYTEVMTRSFKREYGVTPIQFRGAGPARPNLLVPHRPNPSQTFI
jgi:LacI family transcriptional regulator